MKTERLPEDERLAPTKTPRAWLVRAGSAADPLVEADLQDLTERASVTLGRTDPEPAPDRLTFPDPWMSRAHARIERTPQGWCLTDLGSANGTLVSGQRTSRTLLTDGDVIETGSTFWVFRHDLLAGDIPLPSPAGAFGSLEPGLADTIERAERVARSGVPVMIVGETGTGKEILARHIHACSGRSGPFVAINTAAVQSNLVASELFGVQRGAHSMAERSRTGQIRSAHGGTLLLDEVGDMPLEVQVTLLRVLQQNEVLPVGSDTPVPIDVRFLCATHQDIPGLVAEGRFRADLQARLQGLILRIPPLVARREDIGMLVGRFLRAAGAQTYTFSPAAYRALMVFDWPLNVRQLERAVQSAVAVADDDRLELSHLPDEVRAGATITARPSGGDHAERKRELVRLLAAHKGNVSAVARSMGYSRMQVHRWLKQDEINPADYRNE